MKWYNPKNEPFLISGFPFYNTDKTYRRMPVSPRCSLPEMVDILANETAGGQIRFHAKLKNLKIEVFCGKNRETMYPHLPCTTKRGFDFYASHNGRDYEFVGVAMGYDEKTERYEATFINEDKPIEIDILLNFPLYGAVDKILIGTDDEAEISAPEKVFSDDRNIVIYGGSIQQGGCASHPGMCDSNILSRWLNCEVYNLGFDSSGKAEDEVAEIISDIENTRAFVISTEGNCPDGDYMRTHLKRFIEIYREKHPETPIIVMPFPRRTLGELLQKKQQLREDKFNAQAEIVEAFNKAGDHNLHLLVQNDYIEEEFDGKEIWHEIFSDGLHKTDLGYIASAKGLYKMIKKLT